MMIADPNDESQNQPLPNLEYANILVGMVKTESQIRGAFIDQTTEAFVALKDSIAEKGVLEPILVTQHGGEYRLIAGERRLLACRALGMETIPARILFNIFNPYDVTAVQLIENMLREELNPIAQAKAILGYFQARCGVDLDGAINHLILFERDRLRLEKDIVVTVTTMEKITGKSSVSMRRLESILRLPAEVQNALETGALPLSQGYIFVENLDHPKLLDVLRMVLAEPLTNASLRNLFKRLKAATGAAKKGMTSASRFRLSLRNVRQGIENTMQELAEPDIDLLLADLRSLVELMEARRAALADSAV
jgi:ParB family chromosome partitioning protein